MADLDPPNSRNQHTDRCSDENIFQPTSLSALFEMQATKHVIYIYQQLVRLDLGRREDFDQNLTEEVIEEWFFVALCLDRNPTSDDDLKFGELLNKIRPAYALQRRLHEDASWNEIITDYMSEFDGFIKTGIEYGWTWDRILQLSRDTDHINTALRYGADPDINPDALMELISEKTWEIDMGLAHTRAIVKKKEEQVKEVLGELKNLLGVSEDTSVDEFERELLNKLKEHLGNLYGRPSDEVTDEDIIDYLGNQQ